MNKLNKDFLVIQSNSLIEKKRFLNLNEQKVVLVFASLISPEDEEFKTYEVEANKIIDLLEVKNQGKYAVLKDTIYNLATKPIKFEKENKKGFTIMQWFSYADYENGILKVRFAEELKPYLLGLKELFTKYKLENILHMKSKYSVQIFELLKSNAFKKEIELSLEELREFLCLEDKYRKYNDFKKNTIIQSQKEINGKTDINFEFEEIKNGRSVEKIRFIIKTKKVCSIEKEEIRIEIDPVTQANIQTLKALFEIDISEKDILSILDAANRDMAKVISKYYLIKDKKEIKNFTGLLIDAIKEDYSEVAASKDDNKSEIKTKFHNLSEERFRKYSSEEFEKIAIEKNKEKFIKKD